MAFVVNTIETKSCANLRPVVYWRLWLFDAVLVSAGVWFFLATRYGTYEFFEKALAMAILPFIAIMILVGGGGSTIFALTKIWIEKRGLKKPAALALLVGPAFVVTLPLVMLGAWNSPGHRLSYICAGNAPASASHVQITGYSSFLNEEWLAVFHVGQTDFDKMIEQAKLAPVDGFKFGKMLGRSSLKTTKVFQSLPQPNGLVYYKRTFNAGKEHERGSIFAVYDPASSTAYVFREYHD